ncbi:HHL055Wp [Eremothecium sinecaudum]|uniref:HHL055Wp n=1 Tax=Eremothecium sinecaudum TaxID=45286 RepID=A0A0X8HWI5_9SACH|nr:HHL055Wp [Eremothecium sinecaudum]AMD22715.1 HHL055Wp [Eremothecium sinecaudum]
MSLFVQDESDEELQIALSNLEEQQGLAVEQASDIGHEAEYDIEEGSQAELYPLIPLKTDAESLAPDIKDIRPVDVELSVTLPFQQIILENMLVSENCLLVMANGLGVIPVVSNLLHILATPTKIKQVDKRSLVLLLNASDKDIAKIQDELMELSWMAKDPEGRQFTVINSDSHTVDQRAKAYSQGSIIAVTSRILIVDLLSGIVHPSMITGLFIMNAEQVNNYSTESFIADIYSDMNGWGFIKAVTESAESLVYEFSPLLRKMKDLKLKRILLWPRFHADVLSSLNFKKSNTVVEVKVSQTDSMSKIHFGLLECLKKCIDELVRKIPDIAKETWKAENAMDSNFMNSIYAEMQPKWHRISYESKQLVKDISTLRKLLYALLSYDAVDFYELIRIILDANKPSVSRKYSESPWLMVAESQLVISYSKKRVYYNDEYLLEELPKWEQLLALLDDIHYERASKPSQYMGGTLIMCSDERTRAQLRRVLSYANSKEGARKLMIRKLQSYIDRRESTKSISNEIQEQQQDGALKVSRAFAKEEVTSKRRRTRGAAVVAAVSRLHNATGTGEDIESKLSYADLEQENEKLGLVLEDDLEKIDTLVEPADSDRDITPMFDNDYDDSLEFTLPQTSEEFWESKANDFSYIDAFDNIMLHYYNSGTDDTLLTELMPSFIIMYEPSLSFIRRIEVFKAMHRNTISKIYFMYYGDSIEEQVHLSSIKKEKDAFTKIIRENAALAHHFEAPEDLSRYRNLARRNMQLKRKKNTRIAGGQASLEPMTEDIVVVDVREFRAPLPGLLYRYGVRVVPCMLTIGDYIISPRICIERKSIADLIGSFKNGRLVKQCSMMSKYYEIPTLLLEFDDHESFSLEPFGERGYQSTTSSTVHPISSKLMQEEVQMELASLVMRFPNLKIIWSSSPLQTVNIILDLKLGREQPDPVKCAEIGKSSNRSKKAAEDDSAQQLKDLLTVPGLSSIDYFNLKKRCKTIKALKSMSIESLAGIVADRSLAERIFLHIQKESEQIDLDVEDDE